MAKKFRGKSVLNRKKIQDSLITNSSDKPIMIDLEIFESQQEEETGFGSRQESKFNEILAQRKFDEYLIEAIDEALTSLGTPVKNMVYFQLENNFNIPKNEIPEQLGKFSDIIHKIFGFGASRLEIIFIQKLCSKITVKIEFTEYNWPLSKWIINDISFAEYVCSARKNYCEMQLKRGE